VALSQKWRAKYHAWAHQLVSTKWDKNRGRQHGSELTEINLFYIFKNKIRRALKKIQNQIAMPRNVHSCTNV
jgi:hypothetical protein